VDQSAQDLPPPYLRHRQVGARGYSDVAAVRWPQVPGPVRAMLVVTHGVVVQDRVQVPWPGDQHPIGDLGPGCAHPAFGIGVRPRAPRRDLQHVDLCGGKRRVECAGELPGPVPDQKPEPASAFSQVHQQVLPHRRRRQLAPKAGQLAVDAPVPQPGLSRAISSTSARTD
jgi:hypothetical protein